MPQGVFQVSKIKEQFVIGGTSGSSTTTDVELPKSNYLQGLNIRIQCTNGSTSNGGDAAGETITEGVTKIEVVADGVPVYSMSGQMARTIEHFDIGALPAYNETQDASAVQYALFPIKFGRNKNDKEVILPAHMFNSLTLKITTLFTDSTTAGWTTSATTAKLDVIARYLVSDSRVKTPFLKKIEFYSKTLNTIQEETVDLPVGSGAGAYRRLFIRAYEAGIEDGVDIDKYKLVINDSQILVDERWDTSQMEDHSRYGANNNKNVRVFLSDNDVYNCDVSRIKSVAVSSGVTIKNIGVDAIAGDALTFDFSDLATPTAVTTNGVQDLNIYADGISFATVIDIGTDDINDSLHVGLGTKVSSLKLKLNVAAAGAATKVVTEQLVLF